MNRRDFLRSASMICAGLALPGSERLLATGGAPQGWRTFEVTTRIEVLKRSGTTRIWAPAALMVNQPFQRTLSNQYAKWIKNGACGLLLTQP